MKIKDISLALLLIFTTSVNGDACPSQIIEPQCTGKVAKDRNPLFTQAEQHEQNFINALAQCRQADNCLACPLFKQITGQVAKHIIQLDKHLEELAQGKDGVCNVCAITETDDLKNRLLGLLVNTPEIATILFMQ